MEPAIIGAIIAASAAILVALIGLVGKLKKAKLEIERLEREKRKLESLIQRASLADLEKYDPKTKLLLSGLSVLLGGCS